MQIDTCNLFGKVFTCQRLVAGDLTAQGPRMAYKSMCSMLDLCPAVKDKTDSYAHDLASFQL